MSSSIWKDIFNKETPRSQSNAGSSNACFLSGVRLMNESDDLIWPAQNLSLCSSL